MERNRALPSRRGRGTRSPRIGAGEMRGDGVPLPRRGGFLLIDAMIASVVLAVAAIGVAGMVAMSYEEAAVMRENAIAASLGRQLLEEIAAKPLNNSNGTQNTGPGAATLRSQYLSVGYYNGFTDSTTAMTSAAGISISPGNGEVYTRSVTVTFESTPSGPALAGGDFALVTVNVTTPTKQVVSLSRLLAKTTWAL
jgi:hypothetical protein